MCSLSGVFSLHAGGRNDGAVLLGEGLGHVVVVFILLDLTPLVASGCGGFEATAPWACGRGLAWGMGGPSRTWPRVSSWGQIGTSVEAVPCAPAPLWEQSRVNP